MTYSSRCLLRSRECNKPRSSTYAIGVPHYLSSEKKATYDYVPSEYLVRCQSYQLCIPCKR